MAEEEVGYDDSYRINSSYSSDRPIVNLGDITAGLRTTLRGTTTKNGNTYTVNISLPDTIASKTTQNSAYHLAIDEFVSQDMRDAYHTLSDNYTLLWRRFNRLLTYLENWIDDGNLNMSDLKQYVNQE